MADPLITRAMLEARIGTDTLRRLLDYNNDGDADKPSIDQYCEDATSKVRGALGPWYETATTTASNATTATELRRIALDIALAMLARDFPGAVKGDWVPMMEFADRDLKRIQNGRANLGADSPPAQRSQRARVLPSNRSGGRGWDEGNDC